MAERTTLSAKVDDQVQGQFRDYVQEKKGKIRGEFGRELENAMIEYMDNDRAARIEDKLDTLLSELDTSHTHKPSESLEKVEKIAKELQTIDKDVFQKDRVRRAIEKIAGADDRTIKKYTDQLKRQGLAYEHPSGSGVWTLERLEWLNWTKNCVDNNPAIDLNDVISEYPITHDEYIEAIEQQNPEINV